MNEVEYERMSKGIAERSGFGLKNSTEFCSPSIDFPFPLKLSGLHTFFLKSHYHSQHLHHG